jgi:methylated-DNA-[protein]-cysteine S-methyltransferase
MLEQSDASAYWEFETELGWVAIVGRMDGADGHARLERLTFGHASREQCQDALHKWVESGSVTGSLNQLRRENWHPDLARRLSAFAEGAVDDFADIELFQEGRTPFQQAVTKYCRQIPVGETRSYEALARLAGRPGAARAVGSVMASNRFPLVVPCHRVVRADGMIGNFSAPGGSSLKRRLLAHEAEMGLVVI